MFGRRASWGSVAARGASSASAYKGAVIWVGFGIALVILEV